MFQKVKRVTVVVESEEAAEPLTFSYDTSKYDIEASFSQSVGYARGFMTPDLNETAAVMRTGKQSMMLSLQLTDREAAKAYTVWRATKREVEELEGVKK